ncbi:MAG: hypothetical protein ACREBU_10790 [Nitrososphaera sp.]
MSTFSHLLDWSRSKSEICSKIEKTPGRLKIILKTKDDSLMLRDWIEHHQGIAGDENLIIFDNGSTGGDVETIYCGCSPRISVFRYGGFHNSIHYVDRFPELYKTLANSCDYFVFLDTDEFLVWIENDAVVTDPRVVGLIEVHSDVHVFPATWLQNVGGCKDRFWLGSGPEGLAGGLKWGKPIISSKVPVFGLIGHNIQLDKSFYSERILTNCFVLHKSRFSPRQRIEANLKKLIARGVIRTQSAVDLLLDGHIERFEAVSVRMYVQEIRELWNLRDLASPRTPTQPDGSIEIALDGSITYSRQDLREELSSFIAEGEERARVMLGHAEIDSAHNLEAILQARDKDA